jgi:hypothetical protein
VSQAERFGTEFITEKVTEVDFNQRPFLVKVRDQEYRAHASDRQHWRPFPVAKPSRPNSA